MNCLQCGKDIGNDLGVCKECVGGPCSYISSEIQPETNACGFTLSSQVPLVLLSVGFVTSIIVGAGLYWVTSEHFYYLTNSEEYVVGDASTKTYARYELGPKFEFSGVVFDQAGGHAIFEAMGVEAPVMVMSEKDFQEFKALESRGVCPASFLNGAVQQLVPLKENRGIVSLKDISKGQRFTARGRRVRFKTGLYNGQEIMAVSGLENVGRIDSVMVGK